MNDTSNPDKGSSLGRLLPLLLLVLALVGFFASGLNKYFTLDTLRENQAAMKSWVHDNKPIAVAAFIVTYVVVAAASLPVGAVLSISSSDTGVSPGPMFDSALASGAAKSVPISPGQLDVTANVVVIFELK